MTPERWEIIQQLFHSALEQSADEREEFVRSRALDEAMSSEVLEMLLSHEDSPAILETPPWAGSLGVDGTLPHEDGKQQLGPGSTLGAFRLIEEIGRGGMSVVFLAEDLTLHRKVALKVLPVHMLTSPDALARFEKEGRAAAQLKHKSLVSVHSVHHFEHAHCIAMDYYPDGDLAQALATQGRRRKGESPLPSPKKRGYAAHCARLIAEVADGVQVAHDHNLVHRDIKPQNLLVAPDGTLCLSDFGLVREHGSSTLTKAGTLLGTIGYMSPEQAARTHLVIDHRTDIYSLGTVLYEMLALRPAFRGRTDQQTLDLVRSGRAQPIRKINKRVPSDLQLICQHAMDPEQARRYPTAKAFADDLRRFLSHESIVARAPSAVSQVRRHVTRRWRRYTLLCSVPIALSVTRTATRNATLRESWRTEVTHYEELLKDPSFAAKSDASQIEVLEALRRLSSNRKGVPSAEWARVEGMLGSISALSLKHYEAGLDLVNRGFKTPRGIEPFDSDAVHEGFQRMHLARALGEPGTFPNESDALTTLWPSITVSLTDSNGSPQDGHAVLHELDPLTGIVARRTPLGTLPLNARRVPPGYYRIVIKQDRSPVREFTRLIPREERLTEIQCTLSSASGSIADMVYVQGATLELPEPYGSTFSAYSGVPVDVPPFFVDRGMVTVGAYRSFARDTGAPVPHFWDHSPARDESKEMAAAWARLMSGEFDDCPMTGLTWYESRSFAEWRGCRLLTALERDFLARGTEGRLFPNGAPDPASFFEGWPEARHENLFRRAGMAENYFNNVLPSIGSDPSPSTTHRVEQLLGNVWEWTESMGTHAEDDGYAVERNTRFITGCDWRGRSQASITGQNRAVRGTGPAYAAPFVGFRCARSADL